VHFVDDGNFILLKENAMFRTDNVLQMRELRAIMKKDPEVAKWYTDLQTQGEEGPERQNPEERVASTLAVVDSMEDESDDEEQGVVSEEGDGIDEDYRFHRQCQEEGDFDAMNDVSELLTNLSFGGLQLVPFSNSSSSSSSSSSSDRRR